MKNFLPLFLGLFFFTNISQAQFSENPILNIENEDKAFLNWGYFLGFNQYDFKFDYKENLSEIDEILVNRNFGFNVGLIGEMRVNQFLDVRFEPGLYYTQRDLHFFNITDVEIREVQSTYINFPLLLKVSTKRFGNIKPFLTGGASVSMNLGSNSKSLDDNLSGTFRMKKTTYYYELGFGIDFYTEYFKFTPSIKGLFAINDELIRDDDPNSPFTGNIDAMKTRGLFVNFTFE